MRTEFPAYPIENSNQVLEYWILTFLPSHMNVMGNKLNIETCESMKEGGRVAT